MGGAAYSMKSRVEDFSFVVGGERSLAENCVLRFLYFDSLRSVIFSDHVTLLLDYLGFVSVDLQFGLELIEVLHLDVQLRLQCVYNIVLILDEPSAWDKGWGWGGGGGGGSTGDELFLLHNLSLFLLVRERLLPKFAAGGLFTLPRLAIVWRRGRGGRGARRRWGRRRFFFIRGFGGRRGWLRLLALLSSSLHSFAGFHWAAGRSTNAFIVLIACLHLLVLLICGNLIQESRLALIVLREKPSKQNRMSTAKEASQVSFSQS